MFSAYISECSEDETELTIFFRRNAYVAVPDGADTSMCIAVKSYHHQIAKLDYMVDHGLHDSTISDCMSLQSLSLNQLSASAHQNSH